MTTAPAPLFSVLTPVYDPPLDALEAAIESVRGQTCTDWELILVDDLGPSPAVRAALERAAGEDARIRLIRRTANGGIVASSQDALNQARGEFVALLDHDDTLDPRALELVSRTVGSEPEIDYVYTDEDKLDRNGNKYDVFAKPAWSPERLRSHMYTGHLSVIRTSLAREVGGFRPGYDGSQDHDLVLRVTEHARTVRHIPEVLYHWRAVPGSTAEDINAKPYAAESGRRAVADHLRRLNVAATVVPGRIPGTYQVNRELSPDQSVSIIIPTRGGSGQVWGQNRCFVVEAVRSAMANTAHDRYEFVIVADLATPPQVMRDVAAIAGNRLRVVEYAESFNFSRKCNAGFIAAHGAHLVFLNDDIEVITPGWLESLVAPLQEESVGLVGAKLLYTDGTVQHGSHLYEENEYKHAFHGQSADSLGAFGALHVDREASGVTAACVAVRADTFEQVGGFCEELPLNFNDVDFSLKVRAADYRILYLAQVSMYHFESQTRLARVQQWERDTIATRWGAFDVDAYLPSRTGRLIPVGL